MFEEVIEEFVLSHFYYVYGLLGSVVLGLSDGSHYFLFFLGFLFFADIIFFYLLII